MKKRVLAICGFNNTAHIFLEVASLYQENWDIELLLLFEDKDLENFLVERCIPYTIRTSDKNISYIKKIIKDFFKNRLWSVNYVKSLTERSSVDLVFNFDNYVWGVGKWVNKFLNDRGALSLRYAWAVYTKASKNSKLSTVTRAYLTLGGVKTQGQFQLQSTTHYTLCRSPEVALIIGSFGIPRQKLKVVGSHQLELLDALKTDNTQGEGILIISQPLNYNVFIPELKKLVKLLLLYNERPIIKLHPRDNISEFTWFFDQDNVTVLRHTINVSTAEIIYQSAFIITYGSTVALDALYLEKNIIFYDFGLPAPSTIHVFREVAQPLTELGFEGISEAINKVGVRKALETNQQLTTEGVRKYMGDKGFKNKLNQVIRCFETKRLH